MQSKVYFNIRKKYFSIQQDGKVVGHQDFVVIRQPKFKVSEAGRQRVLKTKRKNVHAFVVGELSGDRSIYRYKDLLTEVTYNPYHHTTFVNKKTLQPIHDASWAMLITENKHARIFVIT